MEDGATRLDGPGWGPELKHTPLPPRALEAARILRGGLRRLQQEYLARRRARSGALALSDLAEQEAPLYRTVFEFAPVAMALLDDRQRIVEVNPAMEDLLGRKAAEMRGTDFSGLAMPPYPARLALMARKAASEGQQVVVEHRFQHADGSSGWARTSLCRLDERDPAVVLVCTMEDLTADRLALEEQRREAELDPLTGLLNRRGGDRRLRAALEKMVAMGPVAVIICDTDGFKEINDRFGHAAGDDVLVSIAGRLRSAIRHGDDVARLGGDEFILVARVSNDDEAEAIARRCVSTVAEPIRSAHFG
ncbi:MAG TPA: sensor domain-containing diguanylate cyclase, partial [Acidimicrobiales bacterium]|nr:sensor domain-containing diguanylate cyclase [Acidimicrobiales bacterium]